MKTKNVELLGDDNRWDNLEISTFKILLNKRGDFSRNSNVILLASSKYINNSILVANKTYRHQVEARVPHPLNSRKYAFEKRRIYGYNPYITRSVRIKTGWLRICARIIRTCEKCAQTLVDLKLRILICFDRTFCHIKFFRISIIIIAYHKNNNKQVERRTHIKKYGGIEKLKNIRNNL